jgi:hypothetical protein
MAGGEVRTIVLTVAIITLLAVGLYMVDPTMCGMVNTKDGFMDGTLSAASSGSMVGQGMAAPGAMPGAAMMPPLAGNPHMAGFADGSGGSPKSAGFADGPGGSPKSAGFADGPGGSPKSAGFADGPGGSPKSAGFKNPQKEEGFANLEDITGPAEFGSTPNASGCYPRDQLTPGELLPKDGNSTWAQQNPMGTGSLKGKNFLSAGALVGVNTVGQSLRNANQQLRSEPPNPQVPVSVFFNSTIEPDTNRRDMDIA